MRMFVGNWLILPALLNIPITSRAFELHCQRARVQTALCVMAGNYASPYRDPKQCGWLVTGNVLDVVRISQGQDAAPPTVISLK